jgi:2-oxoglutarate dehydrogenase E1 component
LEFRERENAGDVAVVRLEQLYPFPEQQLRELLSRYPAAKEIFWVQEEPENMGAWTYLSRYWKQPLALISRPESASPATGSHDQHEKEQEELMKRVFQFKPVKAET